jgi:DNA-binding MarR family transcriptional regulator
MTMISRSGRAQEGRGAALEALIGETVALFHRLRTASAAVHGQGELSAGKRGILRDLALHGVRSVPQLARPRPVSRQHIQSLVNPLLKEGYLEAVMNPAHRRSPLLALSSKGRRLAEQMEAREAQVLRLVARSMSERELRAAARTLAKTRQAFAGPGLRAALARSSRQARSVGLGGKEEA